MCYLGTSHSTSPVFLGPRGTLWVFQSWLVVSIIGLNSSAYGFENLEASMMMDPRWTVGNDAHVIMHDKQPTERGNKDSL